MEANASGPFCQLGETVRHEAISNDQTQRNRIPAGECRSSSYFLAAKSVDLRIACLTQNS
jgi:hypothetical protein